MSKEPLPPELGGHLPPDEYAERMDRTARTNFVRDVGKVLEQPPTVIPKQEQAAILRRMADQLDKADERGAVLDRSEKRLADRAQPPGQPMRFFSPEGSPQERDDYWNGRGRDPRSRRAEQTREGEREAYWSERMKAKATELSPMRHFVRKQERDQEPGR